MAYMAYGAYASAVWSGAVRKDVGWGWGAEYPRHGKVATHCWIATLLIYVVG